MVKLFTDAETAFGCSNWRPIPLYLQEPILAVPKKVRTKVYTDIPISNTPTYQAPISPHVFAQNAQSLFQVNPTNFMGSYDALVKTQRREEFENPFLYTDAGLFREYEGLYQSEFAFAGASGGGAISQNLVDIEASAKEVFMEQAEAKREGTGLIKVKKPSSEFEADIEERAARGEFDGEKDYAAYVAKNAPAEKKKKPRVIFPKKEKVMKVIQTTYSGEDLDAMLSPNQQIATNIQPESMPGLITQTKTDETPSVAEEKKPSGY